MKSGDNSHVVPVYGLIESMETRGYSSVRETNLMGFNSTTLIVAVNQSKLITGREERCPEVKDAEEEKWRWSHKVIV